jgi:hypothetical protein
MRGRRVLVISQATLRTARVGATSDVTSAMLAEAWAALGGDSDLLDLVRVTGDGDGLLLSTHAALPAMLAAVSASTLAASVRTPPEENARRHPS